MAPRTEEEKARRKAEYLERKNEREKKKSQEAEAAAANNSEGNSCDDKQSSANNNNTSDSFRISLLELPEDALKQVICMLPAADVGRVSLTCTRLNQALAELREAFLLARLRQARLGSLGSIDMCGGVEEARLMIAQSLGGGDTGRVLQSRKKGKKVGSSADEFVAYARFLEEAVHGYLTFSFRAEGETSKATAHRFVNGRFVSVSPEHSLCRAGGDGHRCGAGGSGVASWGVGKRGQLGLGKREDEKFPRLLVGGIGYGIRIVMVAAGGGLVRVAHSLLLTSHGKVLSFGSGQYGALGHGYDSAKQLPDVLRPKYIDALSHVRCVCVSAGEIHSAAVTVDGDVYTWGDGFCGQCGHGDKRPSVVPKHVQQGGLEDECVLVVSCGSRHTLAVTEDGELFSWGLGFFGALGRSFTPFEYDADAAVVALGGMVGEERAGIPMAMMEPDEQRVGEINEPGLVINNNNEGGIGEELRAHLDLINNITLDDSSDQCYPMVIESLSSIKVVGVSAGHRHSLVLDENGGVYAFGSGKTGCLGLGDNESQMLPVRISEFVDQKVRIMKISAGVDISMAVSTTGQAYSWGLTKGGRIGLGLGNHVVNTPRHVKIQDPNGHALRVVDADCGYVHSLLVALNGTVHICGGVGTDGASDGQMEEEGDGGSGSGKGTITGYPRVIPDFNIWHRVPEPKEQVDKKERWKKYGKYEVKGRKKMLSDDD